MILCLRYKMVRDIELPFIYHTKMSFCQLKFVLYILTKQNGETKPKWWPDNIRYVYPISKLVDISKESLVDLLKSYFKYEGDSAWLRAILFFSLTLQNLTNDIDFTSINISGKILHKGVEFDIVPSLQKSPSMKIQPVSHMINGKINAAPKLNISQAVVEHFKGTKLESNKKSNVLFDCEIDLTNDDEKVTDKDIKLCIKESHIKKLMPAVSVQLYDVVRHNTVHSKEDFLLKLNLMKTDVLSKLNLLKFRRRLRNTSRDSIKSASEFEKDLIKFKSKPNKDVLKEQSKQKENKKKLRTKVIEKDKAASSTSGTETMDVDHLSLPLEIIDVVDEMNKENENSSKENQTTAVNSICSPVPFQQKNNLLRDNSDFIIDLTLEDAPKKVKKETNHLYQFLSMSPTISPKPEKKMKLSPPKNIKRLNRHSMPLMNQKNITSYFNPIPMKLSPEHIAKKLDDLKKVCRPCSVRLDFVKDLKPIRSFPEESKDEIKVKIDTLPLPIVMEEEVTASVIDLTNDEEDIDESVTGNDCKEIITINDKESDLMLNVETTNGLNQKPKKDLKIKDTAMKKKKKLFIKVKWPSKRITL